MRSMACDRVDISHCLMCTKSKPANPSPIIEGWTPLHFAHDNGHTKLAELLVSKGCDESSKNVADEVPKDRLEVFERRVKLRKKQKAVKLKLFALRKLKAKQWKTDTGERAPIVERSRLVRAAALGKTAELEQLLGKDKSSSMVDEFEVRMNKILSLFPFA